MAQLIVPDWHEQVDLGMGYIGSEVWIIGVLEHNNHTNPITTIMPITTSETDIASRFGGDLISYTKGKIVDIRQDVGTIEYGNTGRLRVWDWQIYGFPIGSTVLVIRREIKHIVVEQGKFTREELEEARRAGKVLYWWHARLIDIQDGDGILEYGILDNPEVTELNTWE